MSTLARAVFAALVVATFGAFFVAQRLKNEPTVVQQFKRSEPYLSPNKDGRFETVAFNFKLKKADDVRLDVVDADGDAVRALAAGRIPAYTPRRFVWDGRDDRGRRVPDGTYRLRITLRDEGRAITPLNAVRLDTKPPEPVVLVIGPERSPTPELLPTRDGRPATVRFDAPGRRKRVTVWRTDGPEPVRVTSSGAAPLPDTATSWDWDGTVDGRRVRPGTYLAVVESRDEAGNVGYSVPVRDGVPRLDFGRKLPRRAGITVRYLGVQPPSTPIIAGEKADVLIDARGARWRYTLRRVGERKVIRRTRGASGTGPRLPLRAPNATGTYLLEVRTRTRRATVPIVVQANVPVGRVLVILPWMTWQGRNLVDDDGDGRPNTLEGGVGVRADRVFARDGLPVDFGIREAPVLGFLDRTRRDYDLTTDLALARGEGPKLDEFQGALIPGDARWLPARLGRQLRGFVRGGGTLVSLGTESLRRQADLEGRRIVRPTNPTQADLFGAVLRDPQRGPTELTVADDDIGLFEGDEGILPGVAAYESTSRLDDGELVADAVTTQGRPVVLAARYGRGLVIRTGIPDFAQRLTPRPESAALMNRLWVLMSQGRR
ncbi:MAG: hypothetical protein JWO90_849 [Solirubrobacterales bacterium]|nr:hypothetical protein [Solirubrobacterales bacterium]